MASRNRRSGRSRFYGFAPAGSISGGGGFLFGGLSGARSVPARFGIRGIPTLMIFKGGDLAATKVGALNKAQLTDFIKSNL